MEMRLNLEILQESGLAVRQLRAIGGGAKSPALVQLKADVLDRPITTLAVTEAGCLGVAMLACAAHTGTPPRELVDNLGEDRRGRRARSAAGGTLPRAVPGLSPTVPRYARILETVETLTRAAPQPNSFNVQPRRAPHKRPSRRYGWALNEIAHGLRCSSTNEDPNKEITR